MKIENLKAGYHKNIIVKDLNTGFEKGEIISLIGPNGGGKSTLLKSISGQIKLLGGSVFIGEDAIDRIPLKELSRKMSIVTTDRIKPEHMTCRDVVLSGRLPYSDSFGLYSDTDYSAADKSMTLMKIDGLKEKYYNALSDGQKQRALIARAICQEPEYLIMDEPTSYLDIKHKMELMNVLEGLSEQGTTIIMSLHEPQLALQISDRILMVKSDGGVECSTPTEVLESGSLKELYGLTDEMYKSVKMQLECTLSGNEAEDNTVRHSSYFINKECEYYPCHDLDEKDFNCMFCYCPLYDMEDCGGEFTYTDKGAKNCKNCTFPHKRENYGAVIKKLKEKMYGKH
ncbi:ABC-type cobalamin/Fe3+-siderophores transport system, ATPase component [Butyrivibrio sp. ob235]|uniref:ATP-binding cassette domain-containing protein n=1 Tax=Butyrivibrio sp. ob235 TaxID=1761780 RepID=UPI0008D46E5E|nr:ATP-binding cassette domain-containing protein [Butyrivibrio sp. ob235]SEK23375.1 ABC-type cobalamin/Fe3+-siderophores transport system, ATPase component [Butyrivibrio sp. ob235]